MVSPEVGDFLEATAGTVDNAMWWVNNGCASTSAWTWQWYRDGDPIGGATTQFYEVTSADIGSVLTVKTNPQDQWWRSTNDLFTPPTYPVTTP